MYQRIRDLREDKDLTQTQMAEYLNCSQRIYSNYERGDIDIPTEILIILEEHTSDLEQCFGSSIAVFSLKKKIQ
ncbi:XRE family transcriptional regulator [Paenibacillus sp. 28ISP30-2]|nr:XRE family transcriptional regulator [Paenibacillus sp. 28ISP30-2]